MTRISCSFPLCHLPGASAGTGTEFPWMLLRSTCMDGAKAICRTLYLVARARVYAGCVVCPREGSGAPRCLHGNSS